MAIDSKRGIYQNVRNLLSSYASVYLLVIGLSVGLIANTFADTTLDVFGNAWIERDKLIIGYEADGSASVQVPRFSTQGPPISVRSILIGVVSPHNGSLVVGAFDQSDPLAMIQASDAVVVGAFGHGQMTINPNGIVHRSVLPQGIIGQHQNSTGEVTMRGGQWITGDLYVGQAGSGTLTLSGGNLSNLTNGYLASTETAIATVALDRQSSWLTAGQLVLGPGSVNLAIRNGSQIESGRTSITGPSNIQITAEGSWKNFGNFHIGESLTFPPPVSSVLISDAGSKLFTQSLLVGKYSPVAMTIQKGAAVVAEHAKVGSEAITPALTATLTLQDPGSSLTATYLMDGGSISVQNGASLKVVILRVFCGPETSEVCSLSVSGIGSQVTGSDIIVGATGEGILTVAGGAQLRSDHVVIGTRFPPASGNLGSATVTGVGSMWSNRDDINIGLEIPGKLSIRDGALVKSPTTRLGPQGTLVLGGGTLEGDLINNGGVVTVEDPGIQMLLKGSYNQLAGKVGLEIAGLTPDKYDRVVIHGTGNFEGGVIHLSFLDGFFPHAGDKFDILMADQGLTFTKNMFVFSGIYPDFQFDTQFLDGVLTLTALNDAVPVP
jgi:T5SS/PEP-CTERM-associated repeat protein